MDGKMSQLKARNPGEMMPCRPFYDVSQSIMWKDVCYRMMYTEDDIPKLLKNKDYRKALVRNYHYHAEYSILLLYDCHHQMFHKTK